jgi:hypothetical protein
MNRRPLPAFLLLSLLAAGPAAAELQPRKVPAAPATPTTPVTPAPGPGKTTPPAVPGKPAPATPGTAPAAPAKSEGAPPDSMPADPKLSTELSAKLLKQLDDVEKALDTKRGGESTAMIKQLKEAATGKDRAFNLWQGCKKVVDFEEKGKTGSEFMEWRQGEGKKLETRDDFCISLQLQAQFLALALLDSYAETPEQKLGVMADANAYLEALGKACDKEEGIAKSILASIMDVQLDPEKTITAGNLEETLKDVRESSAAVGGDIMESMFAKKLKPESCTGSKPVTARHPGNVDEIYEKLVMDYLRKKKDAAGLAAAWTRRIALTAAIAKNTKVKELSDRYAAEKLPVLEWLKARDQWRMGQTEAAAAVMLNLIRANPGHKECPKWVEQLRNLATS